MIKTVSHIVLKPTPNLWLKLTVPITDNSDTDSYYSLYEAVQGDYLTFSFNPRLILQYRPGDGAWDQSRSVCIDNGTIFTWNSELRKFYSDICKPEVFTYYDSGMIECRHAEQYKKTIQLRNGNNVTLMPDVIADGDTLYPGVVMCLNIKDNRVELTFDEFEAMYYKFQNFNLDGEGLKLVILKELMENKIKKGSPNKPRTTEYIPSKKNIFQRLEKDLDSVEKESMVDNRRPQQEKDPDNLMDL